MRRFISAAVLMGLVLGVEAGHTATVTLPVTQVVQHKDTTMQCVAPGGTASAHAPDHAVVPPPGGPHCGYYCAPASISMYALFRGKTVPFTEQDQIYDQGKFSQGDVAGDGVISTHGVGLFDAPGPGGVGGPEVQTAFGWSVGTPHEYGGTTGVPFGAPELMALINASTPILWLDHGGYPVEVNPEFPEEWEPFNGHAKIIAGYDDKGTAAFNDDEYLIFDPWPTSGSPYWAPWATVIDPGDLYITDQVAVSGDRTSVGGLKSRF